MAVALNKRRWFDGGRHARRNPYPMMLGLAMGSSTILFFFILIMLVVRKTSVGLQPLLLPWTFMVSTALIIVSSFTITLGRLAFLKEKYDQHVRWGGITLILGLLFLGLQVHGWQSIYQNGFTMHDSVAAAFLFVLSGLHFAHMVGAIGLLSWALIDSSQNKTYIDGYLQSINPAKRTRLLLAYWFWHFTDILWVLLFLVFYLVLQA